MLPEGLQPGPVDLAGRTPSPLWTLGFKLAGAAEEARTGKSWEDLIRTEIFQPLEITHAGFGAPPSVAAIAEPWGHDEKHGKFIALDPALQDADNPPSLGPAGTMHVSLRDWMLFAQDQLDGERGHGNLLRTFVSGRNTASFCS